MVHWGREEAGNEALSLWPACSLLQGWRGRVVTGAWGWDKGTQGTQRGQRGHGGDEGVTAKPPPGPHHAQHPGVRLRCPGGPAGAAPARPAEGCGHHQRPRGHRRGHPGPKKKKKRGTTNSSPLREGFGYGVGGLNGWVYNRFPKILPRGTYLGKKEQRSSSSSSSPPGTAMAKPHGDSGAMEEELRGTRSTGQAWLWGLGVLTGWGAPPKHFPYFFLVGFPSSYPHWLGPWRIWGGLGTSSAATRLPSGSRKPCPVPACWHTPAHPTTFGFAPKSHI